MIRPWSSKATTARAAALAALALLAASAARAAPPLADLVVLEGPAGPRSGGPCLAVAPDGTTFLSWFEQRDSTHHALRVSRFERGAWAKPALVAEGDSFIVNWADFPAVAALGGKKVMVAWAWRSGGDPYAYDVRISGSLDGGTTWTRPMVPHRDGTKTEHGFVSLVPAQNNGVRAFWLDGRKFADPKPEAAADPEGHGGGEMTLRTAWIGFDGALLDEAEVDERVCDCCQIGAAGRSGRVVVAYRDRSAGEVRDISVAWLDDGRWSEPAPVHADGWHTPGCPVNGPAVDMAGERLAVAWFSAAGDTAKVLLSFSDDGGHAFGPAVRVDGGDPLGRVDVALLEDRSALVSWVEVDAKQAKIQVRSVDEAGRAGETLTVARTSTARASGFPRMVRSGRRVFFAWTEAGDVPQVKVATARIP